MRRTLWFPLLLIVTLACDDNSGQQGWYNNTLPNNFNNLPDGGVDSSFRVTEVDPDHGPVNGGTKVTIRGFGFDEYSRIFFNGIWADPSETVYIAPNRMMCKVPPGVVGSASVTVQRNDGTRATLENAYTYDRFSIDPASGSMAGGTFIRITSAANEFAAGDRLFLGEAEIQEYTLVSSGLVVAKTPAHSPGEVNFRLERIDATPLTTYNAYEYYDTTDPSYGGMGGDPIHGTVTVTVLNTYGHLPVEGAFVLLGADLNSPFQGHTDPNGQITFSSADLTGMQMLTVALEEYELLSVIGFDSSEITVFLTPLVPPSSPPGGIPGVPDNVYGQVAGSVIFKHQEFQYSCEWDRQVPDPVPNGYHRALRLYQSLPYYTSPAPQVYTLTETSTCIEGFGYPFSIALWPGSFALYALAGYESNDLTTFIPQSYGIVRNIVVGPGETRQATVQVEYPLNNRVSVELQNPPPLDELEGPVEYTTKLIMNLGSDGYILREDAQISSSATGVMHFENQMSLTGPMADATYALYSEAHTMGGYPFSQVWYNETSGSPIVVDSFLAIPEPISPVEEPPRNNRFAFASGLIKPTFSVVKINLHPDGDPFWTIYLNGEMASFILPNLDTLEGVPHRPPGGLFWHIQTVSIPFLDFNSFTYRYLSKTYWDANAADGAPFLF